MKGKQGRTGLPYCKAREIIKDGKKYTVEYSSNGGLKYKDSSIMNRARMRNIEELD